MTDVFEMNLSIYSTSQIIIWDRKNYFINWAYKFWWLEQRLRFDSSSKEKKWTGKDWTWTTRVLRTPRGMTAPFSFWWNIPRRSNWSMQLQLRWTKIIQFKIALENSTFETDSHFCTSTTPSTIFYKINHFFSFYLNYANVRGGF